MRSEMSALYSFRGIVGSFYWNNEFLSSEDQKVGQAVTLFKISLPPFALLYGDILCKSF